MASNQLIMEEMMMATGGTAGGCPKLDEQQDKKPRPQPEQALKCPRCDSTNTKFCYYNNYSLSQPRYFCKGCRRYWTQGGSLRNVPVGGGCRKNKRSSSSSSSNSKKQPNQQQQDHQHHRIDSNPISALHPSLPPLSYDPCSDLTLAAPFLLGSNPNPNPNPSTAAGAGFLDILRTGFLDTSNPSGFNNLCSYGFDGALLPFDGGLGLNSAAATSAAMSLDANNGNSNVVVDSARDYWNGGYNWHGIINSSLM